MMRETGAVMSGLFINNQLRSGTGAVFASRNPADGAMVWEGAGASPTDVDAAFGAAAAAFPLWADLKLAGRIAYAEAYAEALKARAEALAECISREVGKALWESRAEVQTMIGKVALSIAARAERAGERDVPAPFGGTRLRHRPHGIMGVMGPFNFPGHLPNGHIVPALLAGNVVVFKPSEHAPATAVLMADCWRAAGLPDGVVNVVTGGREAGAALLADPRLAGILFTGSAETGAFIHRMFGGRPDIILALEMGGNNPLILWPPADPEAVADLVVQSAFITTGQRCSCARRLIVPAGEAGTAFIDALRERALKLRIGAWDSTPEPFMGPLVDDQAGQRALAFQAQLVTLGATPILPLASAGPRDAFVSAGIVDVTGLEMPDTELFGPLLQVTRVGSFEEAIASANRTRFGLAGGLICDDEARWAEAEAGMRAGVLNWNRPTTGASGAMPFGGPGLSGNFRPSAAYAADYCAYPVASQVAPKALPLKVTGME